MRTPLSGEIESRGAEKNARNQESQEPTCAGGTSCGNQGRPRVRISHLTQSRNGTGQTLTVLLAPPGQRKLGGILGLEANRADRIGFLAFRRARGPLLSHVALVHERFASQVRGCLDASHRPGSTASSDARRRCFRTPTSAGRTVSLSVGASHACAMGGLLISSWLESTRRPSPS